MRERRIKERKQQQKAVLAAALELFEKGGLDGLTMRKIADKIDYSPCVIYQHYKNKQALLYALFEDLSQELMTVLHDIPMTKTPEEHLILTFTVDVDFMLAKPWRVPLFNTVIGPLSRQEFPSAMQEIANLFAARIQALNYPNLQTKKQIEDALDVLRSLLSGVLRIATQNKRLEASAFAKKTLEYGLKTLLKGWKQTLLV